MKMPRMSADRFSKTQCYCTQADGRRLLVDRYTYESVSALFDIDVDTESGYSYFRKNNRISAKEPQHIGILKHFNLIEPKE